ncbi:beta strand repeat-containing protein, partial [Zavarzinia compransoris]|uniref:beta strand repeat-containing protein n=1 Tax=Zavarzinia compransoris TaxID=1264899 RepID=UPI002442F22B
LGGVSAGGNYTVSLSGATSFRITPAALTVTATAGQSKVYGDLDPALAYTATGFKAGDTAALLTGSLTRAAGENAGDYGIALGGVSAGGNYTVSLSGAPSFRITPAALTVTATAGQSKVYGDLDPVLAYTATGFKAGDTAALLTGSLARAAGENAGDYGITLGGVSAGGNYTVSLSGAPSFRITPAALTVTATAGQSKIYGDLDPALAYTATGFKAGDTAALLTGSLTRTAGENAGDYGIALGGVSAGGNYTVNLSGALSFRITPAALTVTATAGQSKVYGDLDPALTYTATGFKAGDTAALLTGALARAAGENAGDYGITLGGVSAGGNYTVSLSGAPSFRITPAALTVTATAGQSKVYGDLDPALAYTATGFKAGDTAALLTGALARAAGENAGDYGITLGGVSAGGNYTVSLSGAPSFRITPAALTVTATAGQSKVYGDLDPALTYTATGFKAGDTVALLTGALARAAGENAGDYGITLGGVSAGGNYTVSLSGAPSFRITPAALTVTATAGQSKVYGDLDPALAYTATGFKAGDTAALLTGALAQAAGENAGDYGITLGGVSAGGNYTVSLSGTPSFRITPAALTVTATAGQSKVYGDLDPALAYTATGFKAGDTAALLTGSLTRAAGENAGDYGIALGGVTAGGNYTVSLSGAPSFRITPAALTVTATAGQSKVYGDLDPVLAYTATGFKAGDTAALLTGSLARAAGENAGDYGITLGGVSAGGNYTVSLSGAPSFRITPAALTVTATAGQSKIYGDLDPALAYTATGFKA